jgi:hypothetical protein
MRHDWEEFGGSLKEGTAFRRLRRCRNCGATQEYDAEYLWMRVTGYKWTPKAGRCRPNGKAPTLSADEAKED